jgi:hypothetical protein
MDLTGIMFAGVEWFKKGSSSGLCEHGNESMAFVTGGQFLDQLSQHQLLKKIYAPCSSLVKCEHPY